MTLDSAAAADVAAIDAARTAVRYLAEHGYDETTANELADAIGMSRSTFFRRFGSKEDLIFADHEASLTSLERLLDASGTPSFETIVRGTVDRMLRIVSDPQHSRLRSDLLRDNPALRDHELVITHRYERVFSQYLARVAAPGTPRWVPISLAASLVAVHNAAVRSWLKTDDSLAIGALERDLFELVGRYAPFFGGSASDSRVVVAAFDASASPDAVLLALSQHFAR